MIDKPYSCDLTGKVAVVTGGRAGSGTRPLSYAGICNTAALRIA